MDNELGCPPTNRSWATIRFRDNHRRTKNNINIDKFLTIAPPRMCHKGQDIGGSTTTTILLIQPSAGRRSKGHDTDGRSRGQAEGTASLTD